MNETTNLAHYYAARAAEYERVYAKPERQSDLVRLREAVAEFACGRVLEVACGAGYWTAEMARTAAAVVATDMGEVVLAIARAKPLLTGVSRFASRMLLSSTPCRATWTPVSGGRTCGAKIFHAFLPACTAGSAPARA